MYKFSANCIDSFRCLIRYYKYTIKNSFGEELLKDIECSREALIFENFFDKEFGEDEAAAKAYNEWKQAVLEIEEANPYITE